MGGDAQGLAVIGLLSGGLLYMVFRNSPRIGGRHLATACVAVSMIAGLLAGTATNSTLAYFTDTGAVTTGPFAAHTVAQPLGPMNCTGSASASMTVTVPHGDDRYTYVAKVFNNAGTTQLGTDFPMARSGSTWTRTITRQDANVLSLLATYRIRVYARLANTPSWESQSYREWTFSTSGVSILLVLFTCQQRTV